MDRPSLDRGRRRRRPNRLQPPAMIARIWTARASKQNLQRYLSHFSEHVLPGLKSCAGFVSVQLPTREENPDHEGVVTPFWESVQSIDAFAGSDREAAVVAPQAA